VLVDFIKTHQSINTIAGNGKRFMAYDIVNGWKPGSKMMYLVLYQRTWKQRERPIINNIP
jgi:hypothetical protein